MSISSYQPFLIGSGQTQTGLFQYLESWVAPEDAFTDLQDAYINRGQIWKRDGETLLGVLTYCSSQVLGYGTGAAGVYSGTISTHLPILPGSVIVRTRVDGPTATETYTDDGIGGLTGGQGGTGTIDYATGAWSINSARSVKLARPIMIDYTYTPTTATNPHVNVSVVQVIPAVPTPAPTSAAGVFDTYIPFTVGSVFIIADQSNGVETYTDNGAGILVGNLGGAGTINYTTGAWSIDPAGAATILNESAIQLGYASVNTSFTIMGITQWEDETNDTFQLVVEDTRRASVYNTTSQKFDPLCDVSETLFIMPVNVTYSFDNGSAGLTPTFGLIAPLSILLSLVDPVTGITESTTKDNGAGVIATNAYFTAGTVDYLTGRFQITINNALVKQGWAINVTFTLQNDYFTGDQSNFFNWTNWEPATNLIVTKLASAIVPPATVPEDPTQFQRGFLYLTNDVDPITLYRNGFLSRPAFAVRQSVLGLGQNEILSALDVKTFASRLLIVRPTTTISDGNPDPQSIRWSAQFQPTNTVADIPGSGGELSAATSDWIQSTKFLKDYIVVNFEKSVWHFRFTGSAFAPFTFFKANSTKNTNAPYGSIEFDDMVTAMGSKGLIYDDGTTIDRYDQKIFDQFLSIDTKVFRQCFGQRFDILNQSWMLYPSEEADALLSNKVLLWNYMEDSWATFNMALSCLGLGFGVLDMTWADFAVGSVANPLGLTWAQADQAWNSYLEQRESLRLLGGDFNGNVFQLNDGPTDAGTPIVFNVTTKKYNPFAKDGVKAQFGYLDVYYTVNPAVQLTFTFGIDNSEIDPFLPDPSLQHLITLTGTPTAEFGWQRIFINLQTAQMQINIMDNGVAGFRILGMILWAAPAGRITQ